MKKNICFLLLIITIMSCSNNPEHKIANAINKLDNLFSERYSDTKDNIAPGGAVLIKKGDSVLYDKGWGYADIFFEKKIDGNTNFNIASCSKQFTAVAILKLMESNMIDINKSIYDISKDVLPYLPKRRKPFEDITTAQLIAHSSGIPDARPRTDKNFVLYSTDMQSIEYIKDLDSLNFTPGTEYEYINPTYQLLYLFIEKLSHENFDKYMYNNIFLPSNMYNTKYFSPDANIANMAHGYIPAEGQNEWKEYDYGEENFFATKADGGIYTSTHEYANWIRALRDEIVITPYSKSLAWTPITKVSNSKYSDYQNRPNTYYGYGWFIEQQPNYPLKVYHTGDNGGFQIYEGYFPSADLTVLVFENRNDKPRWEMVEKIDEILYQAGLMNDKE